MRITELLEDVDFYQLSQIESFVEALWDRLGVDVKFTRHFLDRLNDPRNGKPITSAELIRLFKKEYERNGKDIAKLGDMEAVMKDLLTNINLPFVMKDTPQGKELVAKTIMRKSNFKTPDPEFVISETLHQSEDLRDVAQWLNVSSGDLIINLVNEPMQKFLNQAKEMYSTYTEFPKDENRTNKILKLLKKGNTPLPVYVDANDPDLFVMEGRHRLVAFWLLGMKTIPVAYVSHKHQLSEAKFINETKKGKGDCFHVAGRNVLDAPSDDLKLVHAMVTGQGPLEGKRFAHAWNEIGDVVLDYSNGRKIVMRKDQYYRLGNVDTSPGNIAVYNSMDAIKNMAKYKHWGPWDLADENP